MTFDKAMLFLEGANQYGSVLGLENMRRLLEGLGNPQDRLKFIHIAGTNGKGSTAAYIASIMAVAGYKVGRYISPSVFEYREKIQITGRNFSGKMGSLIVTDYISEIDIACCVGKIKTVCDCMVEEGYSHPTIFEIETAMAMMYFLQQDCNIVVLEVGLGGRLDATNVIKTTECAVITSISMDHMNILGNTIEQIALEKAGIIKPGIPVVSYQQTEEARKVIVRVCKENHASLETADFNKIEVEKQGLEGTTFSYSDIRKVHIRLLGQNQVKNAVTAILAVKAMCRLGYRISDEDIQNGLNQTIWRGRFEIIRNQPLFLIDGAHNEDAALALAKNIEIYFSNKRIVYMLGVLADKDYDTILKHTGLYAERIITITPNNSRGLQSDKLAQTARKYCSNVIDAGNVTKAIEKAYEAAGQDDVIIAFGSLSYLNEVYEYFDKI